MSAIQQWFATGFRDCGQRAPVLEASPHLVGSGPSSLPSIFLTNGPATPLALSSRVRGEPPFAVLRLSEQAGAERDEMRELPVPIPGRHLGDEAEGPIGVSLRHQDARELPKRKIRLAPV